MCGLTAQFDGRDERDFGSSRIRQMTDLISHRGPDGDGYHTEGGLTLGHRRLSIIDLAGGHQPMFTPDGDIAVVFNGEIYNFLDLRRKLQSKGAVFQTQSDTEAILHAWRQWGPDCVSHLDGMFAFILWDKRTKTFFMARDRLGKKPIYYAYMPDGTLAVGSELKCLMGLPELNRTLDPRAIEDYFAFGYIPDPKTIFTNVHKLPPAHTFYWQRGGDPKVSCYWQPCLEEQSLDEASAVESLTEELKRATSSRLISDVPLGAFLSGGVDSSAIVANMADVMSEPVKSFSIAFGEASFDESRYAKMVAERYHTDHHVNSVDPDDYSLVGKLSEIFDEPFGDSSALPTYRVCEAARNNVTVCLSGDGGDEVFAGYRRSLFHLKQEALRKAIPEAIRRPLFGSLGSIYPKLDWAPRFLRAQTTFRELAMGEVEGYFNGVAALDDRARQALFSASFKDELQGYKAIEVIEEHMHAADTEDPLRRSQYVDLKTWLAGGMLPKVDRTSMAVSLEVRAPLLDHRLVEWGLRLPSDLKIRGMETKYLLKKTVEPKLPHEVLYRPKQGFSVPISKWFRGPLASQMRETAASSLLSETGIFNMNTVGQMVDAHLSGRRDHSRALWLVTVFEAFLSRLEGQVSEPRIPSSAVPAA